MRVLVVLVAVVAACYQPAAQPGAPCSPAGDCPAGQMCDRSATPPVCVAGGGGGGDGGDPIECVDETTCPADAPVCGAGTCRRCAADLECGIGICRELTGRCLPEADTLFVSPAGMDLGSSCTRAQPCATIAYALSLVLGTRRTVRVGNGIYPDRVEIKSPDGAAQPIVLSGEDSTPAGAELGGGGNEGLSTDSNVIAEIEGLRFSDINNSGIISRGEVTLYRVAVVRSNGPGVDVRSGQIRILECTIAGGNQRGISVNGVDADIQRAVITGNAGGGIEFSGSSSFTLINTIVGGNGSPMSNLGGISISGSSTALAFRFNTIAGNLVSAGSSNRPGVQCNAPVAIDSTILTDNGTGDPISNACAARYSLFSANAPAGTGNRTGAAAFVSPTDLHITPASDARDRADPNATEARDVDNQVRSDERRDIGADELQ